MRFDRIYGAKRKAGNCLCLFVSVYLSEREGEGERGREREREGERERENQIKYLLSFSLPSCFIDMERFTPISPISPAIPSRLRSIASDSGHLFDG